MNINKSALIVMKGKKVKTSYNLIGKTLQLTIMLDSCCEESYTNAKKAFKVEKHNKILVLCKKNTKMR